MIFSSKTERFIYEELKSGPATVPDLVKSCTLDITHQAMYLAVRNMIRDGVLVKVGKKIMLNLMVLEQFMRDIAEIQKSYSKKGQEFKKMLNDGETLIYRFNTYAALNSFWNHVWLELIPLNNATRGSWLTVDATPYWYLLYPKEAFLFIDLLQKRNYDVKLVFDEEVTFPRGLISKIRTEGVQVAYQKMRKTFKAYNVFDDIIVEVTYPAETYRKLHEQFVNNNYNLQELRDEVANMSPFRVRMVKNAKKAAEFTKKYKKYFLE